MHLRGAATRPETRPVGVRPTEGSHSASTRRGLSIAARLSAGHSHRHGAMRHSHVLGEQTEKRRPKVLGNWYAKQSREAARLVLHTALR
jgi:hypothetical protein